MNTIVNDPSSFGKLNAILYFKDIGLHCQLIYNDIIRLFEPNEIHHSLFHLDKIKMIDINISELANQYNNGIIRIIFIKQNEEIILECYKEHFIIEHLISPSYLQKTNGISLINKFKKEKANSVLVVGYELSINIDDFESSLKENIYDSSLHPIIVLKNNNYHDFKKYISNNNEISKLKMEVIKQYIDLQNTQ